MDRWAPERRAKIHAAVFATVAIILWFLQQQRRLRAMRRQSEPSIFRDLTRKEHMQRILRSGKDYCVNYIKMDVGPFMHLASIMRDRYLLRDTRHLSIEEQLTMFLHVIGHNTKNRTIRVEFLRSGETISRYFNDVLRVVLHFRDDFVQPPGRICHPDIENNNNWYPYFKDCIGLLDVTHIVVFVPPEELPLFRGRKGKTQNVLVVVNPDLKFTYVLAGWEGSANDFTILKDALSRPQPEGLRTIEGKYYLVDAGYTTLSGFICPYRGVRYHLKEHSGRPPTNSKELFNLRHSTLSTKVDRAFGKLKNRFKILTSQPFFPYRTQVKLVIAACILHNYIAGVDPNDDISQLPIPHNEDSQYASQYRTQREQREENRIWLDLRDTIANDMWAHYIDG